MLPSILGPSFPVLVENRDAEAVANRELTILARSVWLRHRQDSSTWLSDIRATFFFHMGLVGEPLNTLSKSVHIGVLKYVYGHDDLVITNDQNECQ